MKTEKLLEKVLRNPHDVRFDELDKLLSDFGFELKRIEGSHHIYKHVKVPYLINIQNRHGKVKFYQVKQFINIMNKYQLKIVK